MAVPVVEAFTFNTAGSATTSVDLTKPAGVQVGELLIMLVGNEDNTATTSFAAITGWTKAYEYGNATPDTKIGMYWRIADGTEAATETIDWTATGTDFGGGWYLRVSGVDTDSPIHISGTSQQSAGASSLASLSVTTTLNDCLIFSHMSGDGGDTYPFSSSGTGWPTSIPTNQELQDTTATSAWAGAWITRSLATAGASGNHTWGMNVSDGIVTVQFAVAPIQEGIQSVAPTEFNMDTASITISGLNFGATQGTGTVYISDANTLAGSANEVEIANGINTWSDTSINLDLTGLNATELSNLHTLGPGQRYVIVVTNASDEYGSTAITLHRPDAFVMSLSTNFAPGTTTQRLTGLTGTFAGGRIEEALNPSTTNTDVATDGNREDVANIQATADARAVSYDFRVLYGGNVPDTITQTPQITVTAGDFISVGQITETDTANAISVLPGAISASVGQVVETNLAKAIVAALAISLPVGLAAETNTAQTISPVVGAVSIPVGQASETSTAQSIGISTTVSLTIGQITESDTAQAITPTTLSTISFGQASETDTAQIVTPVVQASGISVGQITETDVAQSIGIVVGPITTAIGQITETDTAQSITLIQGAVTSFGQVAETDTAQSISIVTGGTLIPVNQVTETDAAQAVFGSVNVAISQVVETDTANTVPVNQGLVTSVGLTTETDTAQSISVSVSNSSITVTQVVETDTAQAIALGLDVYGGTYNAIGNFPASSSVTIELHDPVTWDVISLSDNACIETPAAGIYIWDTSKLTTQPSGYQEYVWSMTDSITVKGGIINMISADDIATAVWDNVIEGPHTATELMRIMSSVLAGKASGLNTNTPVFRDIEDTMDRVSATTDDDGNRTTVIHNMS